MNFRKIGIALLLLFCLLPAGKALAQATNAGFVPGNIWYVPDTFEEGDKVKIYTVIYNSDSREFSGTVVFFDNNVFLGKKDFKVSAKGVQDVFIDWTANVGKHAIFGKIENAKFLLANGQYEEVYIAYNQTAENSKEISKKIVPAGNGDAANAINNIVNNIGNLGTDSVKNASNSIVQAIENNTPEIIAKPFSSAVEAIENTRQATGTAAAKKQTEVKKEIAALNEKETQTGSTNTPAGNSFLKPFKYTELFALALFSTIFNNQIIFYSLAALLLFLLLRYLVRRVK